MTYLVILAVLVIACLVLRKAYLPLIGCALCVGFVFMTADFAAAMKRHQLDTLNTRMATVEAVQ